MVKPICSPVFHKSTTIFFFFLTSKVPNLITLTQNKALVVYSEMMLIDNTHPIKTIPEWQDGSAVSFRRTIRERPIASNHNVLALKTYSFQWVWAVFSCSQGTTDRCSHKLEAWGNRIYLQVITSEKVLLRLSTNDLA